VNDRIITIENNFVPMKNKFNIKYLPFLISIVMSTPSFSQNQDSTETIKIESGKIVKNIVAGKLESFVVEMYAVNYGNALTFTKESNQIIIRNAQEPDAIIKIAIEDKNQIRELLYDNKVISSIKAINFDLDNLPKNSQISNRMVDGKIESYVGKSNLENIDEHRLDKTLKLFFRLDISAKQITIDAVFSSISDFFSQEDALLKIYSGKYAEQTQPLMTAYLKTNEAGKIEKGIIWTAKEGKNGKYDVYNNGKIVKTEFKSLSDFQKTIMDYLAKSIK